MRRAGLIYPRNEQHLLEWWQDHIKPIFLVSLLLSTWVPMAFFLVIPRTATVSQSLAGMKSVLLFLGTAHVPATIFFFIDGEFSGIIRKHKARYVYFPILLTVSTGLLFAFSGAIVQAYILLTYWAWQAFHYGRQNVGIYSFVSIAQRGVPPHRLERMAIELGTYCGILGTFKILGMAVAPDYLHELLNILYKFGRVAFVVVLVFSIFVYAKNLRRTTTLLTIFFFTLVCFFLPVFLSTDVNVAFLSYAIAHGLQYILFMTVVSLNFDPHVLEKRFQLANTAKLLAIILVVGFVFYRMGDLKSVTSISTNKTLLRMVDFAVGAILGATMAHFVIDAGAWKLSRALQRVYIVKRFGFLFDKRDAIQP